MTLNEQEQDDTPSLPPTLPPSLPPTPTPPRRKLKPLIITLPNSPRQTYITQLFNTPQMKQYFHPPTFSPGIPSRDLRNCYKLLSHANNAGIIPQHEWECISKTKIEMLSNDDKRICKTNVNDNLGLLSNLVSQHINVIPGRKGSVEDTKRHYCIELWQKAKSINRGRNVLACLFAHLIAMRTLVEEGYDFILEDNVRAPLSLSLSLSSMTHSLENMVLETKQKETNDECECECAKRIYETKEASEEWEKENKRSCHLRYYGWLGSRPNLEFIINTHCPRTRYQRKKRITTTTATTTTTTTTINNNNMKKESSFFLFPITSDFDVKDGSIIDPTSNNNNTNNNNTTTSTTTTCDSNASTNETKDKQNTNKQTIDNDGNDDDNHNDNHNVNIPKKAGGTPIWGAYAYWISKKGHEALIQSLQNDVGSILWKGKRMRCYLVKPIDKVMPRKIIAAFSSSSSSSSSSGSSGFDGNAGNDGNDDNAGNDDNDDNDRKATEEGEGDDGRDCVHVATDPAFFRAPMLTSQIHRQWDAEFCRSTEYQMISCLKKKNEYDPDSPSPSSAKIAGSDAGSDAGADTDADTDERKDDIVWDSLWLNEQEREIVEYKKKEGKWLTLDEMATMKSQKES